ncbi:MAG: arsenate reductase [Chitinophagales bacterium]|nr:hypothetical protein [Chitinophagales bacterium]HAE12812.1 arsenate reductase [Bacteroidota bacterium]MCB9020089.1 arsenate reductase [Chitinophagales bacterium]MCB9020677.1 arsenate reductase [Chitinophagales bacterium]MCB9031404.1 arsenate reductase [Chitinophagales bacterium]
MAAVTRLHLYYLSTCDTCARIMKELQVDQFPFVLQDIKYEPVTRKQAEEMAELVAQQYSSPPYESLFSKVALKYRSMGLNKMDLTEADYKKYLLQEYTFLKRPVFIIGNRIFMGNAPKTILAVAEALHAF